MPRREAGIAPTVRPESIEKGRRKVDATSDIRCWSKISQHMQLAVRGFMKRTLFKKLEKREYSTAEKNKYVPFYQNVSALQTESCMSGPKTGSAASRWRHSWWRVRLVARTRATGAAGCPGAPLPLAHASPIAATWLGLGLGLGLG